MTMISYGHACHTTFLLKHEKTIYECPDFIMWNFRLIPIIGFWIYAVKTEPICKSLLTTIFTLSKLHPWSIALSINIIANFPSNVKAKGIILLMGLCSYKSKNI